MLSLFHLLDSQNNCTWKFRSPCLTISYLLLIFTFSKNLMLLGFFCWGCQLHSAEGCSNSWPLAQRDSPFHQILCSMGCVLESCWRQYGIDKVQCRSAFYLEERLISGVKIVGVLWPQDTLTTVHQCRNVLLEHRPWLLRMQKFLVL